MTVTTRSGIPTSYRQGRFRSRLEARWAAFFDLVGWSWVYEPFDETGWIPDFIIRGPASFLVEVGPCETASDYREKGQKARAAFPGKDRLYGQPGDQVRLTAPDRFTLVCGITPVVHEPSWRAIAAGYWAADELGETSPAFWYRCPICDGLSVDYMFSRGYGPCGHVEDPEAAWHQPGVAELEELWLRAGNETQWSPA